MKFRIQKRLYSSDVIEASTKKENGKDKWSVYLIPSIMKVGGDPLCERLLKFLQDELPSGLKHDAYNQEHIDHE